MKNYLACHWDLVQTTGWNWNMVFDHDAGTDLFAIFLGTLADIGIAAAVIYLFG